MENYTLWSKSMRIALLGKNKIGFIDGTCRKEMYEGQMANQWERVNAIVLSWIMSSVSKDLVNGIVYSSNAHKVRVDLKERFDKINATRIYHIHRGISTQTQGTATVSSYFSKLSDLWEEYESLVPPPTCTCERSREFIGHLEQQKLMQFLGGLNENYNQSRSHILMMIPLPSVNQAYSLIIHEESQRAHLNVAAQSSHQRFHYEEGESSALVNFSQKNFGESSAMASANFTRGNNNSFRVSGSNKTKRNSNLQCEFCHLKGHSRETCYKLIGYPSNFKFTRNKERDNMRNGSREYTRGQGGNYAANNAGLVIGEDTLTESSGFGRKVAAENQVQQPIFTAEQFQKLLSLIDKQEAPEAIANMAGSRVRIECKKRDTNDLAYTVEGVTNSKGEYKILVNSDRGDEFCDVILIRSSDPMCAEPNMGRDRARVVLTSNNGMVSKTRFANSMGFLSNVPLPSCTKILQQYQDSEDQF